MNVSFLQNQPLDTVIINSADGRPLYEVKTPWKLANRVTSILRTERGVPPGRGQIVAEVHWQSLGSTKVVFMGSTMKADEFLRKDGMFSSARTVTGTDGRLYKWKHSSNKFTLFDSHTNTVVAESHRSKSGLFTTPRKMNIDVSPQGMHTLDAIIVSFIIMEERHRQTTRGGAAANAATVGAASG